MTIITWLLPVTLYLKATIGILTEHLLKEFYSTSHNHLKSQMGTIFIVVVDNY